MATINSPTVVWSFLILVLVVISIPPLLKWSKQCPCPHFFGEFRRRIVDLVSFANRAHFFVKAANPSEAIGLRF
jgi:hypothetical protein